MALFQLPRTVGTYNELPVVVNIGRYGPYIQYNSKFYALPKTEDLWSIGMDRCIEIMETIQKAEKSKEASVIGEWDGMPLSVAVGKFGPYILYNKHFYALPKDTDIHSVSVEQAKDVIRKYEEKFVLRRFEEDAELRVLKGKYGPYIAYKGSNYKLPKDSNISELTYAQCTGIIKEGSASGKAATRKRKATTRKSKA